MSKQERTEKRTTPVVSNAAKVKKKSELSKLSKVFISEDIGNVGSYVFLDVLVPAIKKAIVDIVTDGIDMIMYGESGRSNKRSGGNATYVSYNRYSDPRDNQRAGGGVTSRTRFDFDNIIFATRGDAEAVLGQMIGIIEEYDGFVTVADLYDLADLPQPYTSNRYGWTNLRNASVQRARDGYVLKLPKPMAIE